MFETFAEQVRESGPLEMDGYSYIEIICHSPSTANMVEKIEAPFYEAKQSTPNGFYKLTQYSATSFSVDTSLSAYIDKITAYK